MSTLQAAMSHSQLMIPNMGKPVKTRTKLQVAKRVFQLAASGGFPYQGMSYQQWAKKWLGSDTFRLMEIDINAAASPHLPKNPERVAYRLLCSVDSVDPIVVDINKQKTGKSRLGYIPKVVVLDGKHRKQAQMLQGRTRILAWVGCKAEGKLHNIKVIDKLDFRNVKPTVYQQPSPCVTAYALHCATVPATGQVMLDQSGGEEGSRPRDAVVKAKSKKCPHCGSTNYRLMPTDFETAKCKSCGKNFQIKAQGSGPGTSNTGGSGSNPLTMNIKSKKEASMCACRGMNKSEGVLDDPSASDDEFEVNRRSSDNGSRTTASDRRNYLFPRPQIKAPGALGWSDSRISPDKQSPGSGTGPRVKRSTGATRSEMSRLADVDAKGKIVRKIFMKAPPGMEDEVMDLKKKYGADSSTPFKIAWSNYKGGK